MCLAGELQPGRSCLNSSLKLLDLSYVFAREHVHMGYFGFGFHTQPYLDRIFASEHANVVRNGCQA